MKIIQVIYLIIVFCSLLISSFTGSTQIDGLSEILLNGDILYVGGSGPGNYTSIQDAIDSATSGDTIYVYSGTYYEQITIDKTIILQGENKQTTIIHGVPPSQWRTLGITENADNSRVSDFSIRPLTTSSNQRSGRAIDIESDNCFISNIIVLDAGWSDGIYVLEVNGCSIENCYLAGYEYTDSYMLYYSIDVTIRNCTTNSGEIAIAGGHNIKIIDCLIRNAYDGIACSTNNLLVQNCTITNPMSCGLAVLGGDNYRVEGCTILNAGDYGMYIPGNTYNIQIRDCYIAGTKNYGGIIFWGSNPRTITNCTFVDNNRCGINFYQGWRLITISQCQFINNRHGIESGGYRHFFGNFIDNTFANTEAEIKFWESRPWGLNRFSQNFWLDWSGIGPYHVFGFLNWDFQPRMTPLLY